MCYSFIISKLLFCSKGKQKIVNILERKTIFNKVGKCLYSTGNADPVFSAHSRG